MLRRRTARNPPGTAMRAIAKAEKIKDSELIINAALYPKRPVLNPANIVPAVRVAHCVVCVSELAE